MLASELQAVKTHAEEAARHPEEAKDKEEAELDAHHVHHLQ